ncbi:glycosyltransferase family 4 protein [Breznakiella homolactica]|uniref:Glycosyltransferase family 4 protein n=1 Tax=Breznakiella homolactica TaxID=2798577 RepID=A0A7T7XNV5_9SPIR|nr:glycosyltransferase family 1 protein [Breznakiella homolactica]QQO09794.1 glycosyltransferase family 4 protein [Breznakiella homolactica]
MKIAIDCRVVESSGIGVYLRECLPFFVSSGNELLLLGDEKVLQKYVPIKSPNVTIFQYTDNPFSIKELTRMPGKVRRAVNSCGAYYSPYFNIPSGVRIPVYTTIHDVLFPDMPELTSKIGLILRMFFYRRAVRRSKCIFTVSEFSRSRIQHYFGTKKPVLVTYNGISNYLLAPGSGKPRKYLLFIGNIKKQKGLSVLTAAFAAARQEGLGMDLVIVGSAENFRTKDTEITASPRKDAFQGVSFTGHVSDDELLTYLRDAALLVQPSLYEGFGIPPLEAMSQGTPALVSDIPVFKEIYRGFPVSYFEAGNVLSLKEQLLLLCGNGIPPRVALTQKQRDTYTYQKTAGIILGEIT